VGDDGQIDPRSARCNYRVRSYGQDALPPSDVDAASHARYSRSRICVSEREAVSVVLASPRNARPQSSVNECETSGRARPYGPADTLDGID